MIIFCEVMFDKHTSGELPEHIRFIKEKCIPTFSKWGYKTEILRAEKTYITASTMFWSGQNTLKE